MVGRSLLLLIAIFAFTGTIVNAETSSNAATPSAGTEHQTMRDIRLQKLTEFRDERQDLRQTIQEKRAEMSQEIKTARDEFKEKLASIKDQRKKLIVQRVDQRFNAINQDSTNRMVLAVNKLNALLDKFASRAAKLKAAGKDTTQVDQAVVSAQTAIADAKAAIATQAAKDYTINISSESALRSDAGQTMKQLREDLKATLDVVKIAKQKVIDVARALAKLTHGENISGEPSEAPVSQEPTLVPSVTETVTPTVVPSI